MKHRVSILAGLGIMAIPGVVGADELDTVHEQRVGKVGSLPVEDHCLLEEGGGILADVTRGRPAHASPLLEDTHAVKVPSEQVA